MKNIYNKSQCVYHKIVITSNLINSIVVNVDTNIEKDVISYENEFTLLDKGKFKICML